MSERKVLNKYYPPDFDASKLPRLKREKNRQFTIRLMAPFNMRCTTCGEYIYRGKKFNAKKEDVIGKTYLGIQVYRFYIKCTKCLAEITFLTDPENQDYAMEFGAIRNFESVRLAEIQAEKEAQKEKEEEENNPMKILENRTRDSRREMAALDALEDLRELNAAHATVDASKLILEENAERRRQLELQQIEEDEAEIRRIFGNKNKEPSLYGQIEEEIIEEEEQEESENEEEKDETNAAKKLKSEPIEHNESESATNSEVKRIKVEPTMKEEEPKSSSVLFKKPVVLAAPKTVIDTKTKISSLIKKKPEPEKPKAVNPLASLASYSSDESESD